MKGTIVYMRRNPLAYPETLKYFQLDRYIDPSTNRIIRIPSTKPHSFEAKTKYALSGIEKDDGTMAYLNNRLREQISCFAFAGVMGTNLPVLSTIVNDVYFNVDATGDVRKHKQIYRFAIDFTEKYTSIQSKLVKTNPDGIIRLQGENGYIELLPLVVVTIASELVNHLLNETEKTLTHQRDIHPGILRSGLTAYIDNFFKADYAPAAIFDIHTRYQGDFQQHMLAIRENKINYYKNNPPPSR